MKLTKIISASILGLALGSCTSYEIEMPANPEPPTMGPEVAEEVIYQVNPRFYGNTDALKSLAADVPEIAGLGVDLLWVMPICSPGTDAASIGSPYCIKDFKAVNPQLGTMDDFKAVVAAAHASGMKVVLDWIANHTSWDNAWISSNPERYAKDANGNITAANGWTDVAQLDYSEPSTVEAMTDAMLYWINEAGIDGYRCDYADGVPHEFWASFIERARAVNPDFIMLAETSKADFYNDGFDMIYDWSFSPAVSAAFRGGKVSDIFVKAADSWKRVPEGKSILRYAFNHDVAAENDFASYFSSPEGIPGAYVLAAFLHGTPMIYQPMLTENLSGTLSFFNYRTLGRSEKLSEAYKAINKAYRETSDVRRGTLRTYADNKVAMFTRSVPGSTILVMVNTTGSEQTVKTPITLAGAQVADLISGESLELPVSVTLPAYGYLILRN